MSAKGHQTKPQHRHRGRNACEPMRVNRGIGISNLILDVLREALHPLSAAELS